MANNADVAAGLAPGVWTRYELQIALMDRLFSRTHRIRSASSRSSRELTFREESGIYDWRDNDIVVPHAVKITVTAPMALDVACESVLLAILHLARQHGQSVRWKDLPSSQQWLKPSGLAADEPISVVRTSQYAVLKLAGFTDGAKSYRRLKEILMLLGKTILTYENLVTHKTGNDLLLQWELDAQNDQLLVQLNWRLTGALFGPYLYALVDLEERRQLSSDAAKVLHRWLSAHLWPGKQEWIREDTILRHVWSDDAVEEATWRTRRYRLHEDILPQLRRLEPTWNIRPKNQGWFIRRQPRQRMGGDP